MLLPKPLAWTIIGVVTAVWSASQIAAILMTGYTTDPMLHTIFMAVVGGAFALKGRGNGNGSGSTGRAHHDVESETSGGQG